MLRNGLFIGFALGFVATAAHAAPIIDGNVQGFGEGYTQGFGVSLDIENGPTVAGGQLFIHDTPGSLSVGLISPLSVNDNTYGTNKASDWAGDHKFDQLDGSDKWEMTFPDADGKDVKLKLDYIDEVNKDDGLWDARVEKAEQDKNDFSVDLETSLSFNNEQLGLSTAELLQVFGKDTDSPVTGGGDYDFLAPYEDWVPEIMYEFSIDKTSLPGAAISVSSLLNNPGLLHMSPNKGSDKNKVFLEIGDRLEPPQTVPEPATLLLFGTGLAGIGFAVHRRRKTA